MLLDWPCWPGIRNAAKVKRKGATVKAQISRDLLDYCFDRRFLDDGARLANSRSHRLFVSCCRHCLSFSVWMLFHSFSAYLFLRAWFDRPNSYLLIFCLKKFFIVTEITSPEYLHSIRILCIMMWIVNT